MRPKKHTWIIWALLAAALLLAAADRGLAFFATRTLSRSLPGARVSIASVRPSPSGIGFGGLSVRSADWQAEGHAAFNWKGEMIRADIRVPLYRTGNLEIRGASLRIGEPLNPGELHVTRLTYKKLSLEDLRAVVRISGKSLTLEPMGAAGPYGRALGSLRIDLEKEFPYEAYWKLFRIAPGAILRALEWDSKASLSGFFTGTLSFAGRHGGLTRAEGVLNAEPPGGELNITNPALFADLATRTKQPVELIEAGFSSYHFDTGRISVSAGGTDLRSEILLEGPAGRRRLEPVIHDFFKKENG